MQSRPRARRHSPRVDGRESTDSPQAPPHPLVAAAFTSTSFSDHSSPSPSPFPTGSCTCIWPAPETDTPFACFEGRAGVAQRAPRSPSDRPPARQELSPAAPEDNVPVLQENRSLSQLTWSSSNDSAPFPTPPPSPSPPLSPHRSSTPWLRDTGGEGPTGWVSVRRTFGFGGVFTVTPPPPSRRAPPGSTNNGGVGGGGVGGETLLGSAVPTAGALTP